MLDIKFIRENLEVIKMAVQKKHMDVDMDRLISVDDSRRELMSAIETKKAEQNKVSKDVAGASKATVRQQLILEMQSLKVEIQADEEKLKQTMKEWQALMLQVPQVPDMTVPDGDTNRLLDEKLIRLNVAVPRSNKVPALSRK